MGISDAILLSALTAILQLINRSINKFYSFIVFSIAVILLLHCLGLIVCCYIHFFCCVISPTPLHNCSERLLCTFSSLLYFVVVSHYFSRLWGTIICDAIFHCLLKQVFYRSILN